MPFRSGAIGYSRFRVVGETISAPDEALFRGLREHAIAPRATDVAEASEVVSGFCTGRHVFDHEFTHEQCGFGASLLAALRLDTCKVPSAIRHAYRSMAEDARRGQDIDGIAALSRTSKREAKDDAEERCKRDLAEGKHRKVAMFPFLWDLPEGLLLAPLASDVQCNELKSLFDSAFALRLERRSAGTVALDLLGRHGKTAALDDAMPDALVAPPEGPTSDDEREEGGASAHFRAAGRPSVPWAHAAGEPNDFLGNLFLLWLWWQVERNEGVIETSGPTVALAIERTLDMECAWGVTGIQNLRGDAPSSMPEAAKALAMGKWPRKLGLLVAAHGQEFRCVLQGDRFAVSGLALPKPEDEAALSPRQDLEQRVDLLLTFDRVLVALFEAFLAERFGPSWETRAGQLREWIARLGRGRVSRSAGITEVKVNGTAAPALEPIRASP